MWRWQMPSRRSGGAKEIPRGLEAVWGLLAGRWARLAARPQTFLRRAARLEATARTLSSMSEAALREAVLGLKEVFRRGRESADDVLRAHALVSEVAARVLGERPHAVQVAAALAMVDGHLVELMTGEGKTLAATMPAMIAGWRGRGCHVITVNDYLAQRDAEWMRGVYRFCAVTVAHVRQEMRADERRRAYAADVTYCTNKEAAADYLRDRLLPLRHRGAVPLLIQEITARPGASALRPVQRGLAQAIVDEADSVLVDEAVTPLLISGEAPDPERVEAYRQAGALAAALQPQRDYRIDPRHREIGLTPAGRDRLAAASAELAVIWRGARRREELVVQALAAREFHRRDVHYVVQDGTVVIVDEFTGRQMPDRTWRHGLHQAVQAKENLAIDLPKDTHARISFQRFFRLYERLCGMTGTAAEAWAEFWQVYRLPVVALPTHRPCRRTVLPDCVFVREETKWKAVVEAIRRVHATGRPILIGARSVAQSENLGRRLDTEGLAHQVLNAVRDREEAQIVAGAGQPGRITVATNMAGRGTDIKLGAGVASLGGLHVIATERHEAGRIDRQLFGRCARQGDPGSVQAFLSLEDELVRRHTPFLAAWLRRDHCLSAGEISGLLTREVFDIAQRRAEARARRMRLAVLRTDRMVDEWLGFTAPED